MVWSMVLLMVSVSCVSKGINRSIHSDAVTAQCVLDYENKYVSY